MKLELCTFLLALTLTGSVFAQQNDPEVGSPAIQKQKAELEATLISVNQKLAMSEKTYRDAQTKKVKYDTIGLGAWRAEMGRFKEEKNALTITFVKQHPDYFASLLALKDVIGALPKNVQLLQRTFAKLDKNIQQSVTGVKTKAILDKFNAVSIGRIAPGFSAPDTAGKTINLADFKGKYVLLDFWASWCGPCREENPIVVKAYNTYKDRNFEILSVSLDQPGKQDAWLKAIHDDQLNWKHVSDLKYWKNEVAQLYSVMSIPQNFLIDPNGKIVAANLRGEELAKKLAILLPQSNQGK